MNESPEAGLNERPGPSAASVVLSESELTVLIGGTWEALFELGDQEFATRVGVSADEARVLLDRLKDVRNDMSQ